MNFTLAATLLQQCGALTPGSEVRLLEPVRETGDWTVSDPFGYVLVIPKGLLRLKNRTEAVMRLEAERSQALLDLQDVTRGRSEIVLLAARSYELGRLLAALPEGL